MEGIHTIVIAAIVSAALMIGGTAIARSRAASAPTGPTVSQEDLAARASQLDAVEAEIARRLAAAPPARPPATVRYVRPSAPVSASGSRRHHDDGEHEGDDD